MKLIFIPCGDFRWSQEGPASQIHSPYLHVGALGIFSDLEGLFRCWRGSGVPIETGSYCTYSNSGKTAALVPEFAVEELPSAELQTRILLLQWRTCPWAEQSDGDYWHRMGKYNVSCSLLKIEFTRGRDGTSLKHWDLGISIVRISMWRKDDIKVILRCHAHVNRSVYYSTATNSTTPELIFPVPVWTKNGDKSFPTHSSLEEVR